MPPVIGYLTIMPVELDRTTQLFLTQIVPIYPFIM